MYRTFKIEDHKKTKCMYLMKIRVLPCNISKIDTKTLSTVIYFSTHCIENVIKAVQDPRNIHTFLTRFIRESMGLKCFDYDVLTTEY